MDDLGPGNGLNGNHDDPEIPVEPTDQIAGPIADPDPGKVWKGLNARRGHGHLSDHPHDQQDEKSSQGIADHRRRADGADGG